MHELIEAIKAWPIIIQGCLGSALFWLILQVGQNSTKYAVGKYSFHSKKSRLTWLTHRRMNLEARLSTTNAEHGAHASLLLYRASRPLFKALMWFSLTLISPLFMPALVIGFIGGIYYLFNGYNIVAGIPAEENESLETLLAETIQEINLLEANK
jgi:hypothetical protein